MRRRRRVQPVLFIAWIAGSIALVGILLYLGFLAIFAPRLMAWVEENPGTIENGIVQDFVEWYRPGALADRPASSERQRITVEIPQGVTDTEIGNLLLEAGVIDSRLAFQFAVIQAERQGTLAFGTYDLSPTMRPSQIIGTLQGVLREEVRVTFREGKRLEEIVATFGESDLTINLEDLAALMRNPPADILNQYDFLNDVAAGRSLEGYLMPNTYDFFTDENEIEVLQRMLGAFGEAVTPEIRQAIADKSLSIDDAVIIASIVEREAVVPEERPLIASVFINRIQNPNAETVGLLNADPTVQYGAATAEHRPEGFAALEGTEGAFLPVDLWGSVEWWPPLQVAAGEIGDDWPEQLIGYHTYLIKGLPPTPISAPRIESIQAVASAPLDRGLLYFVAGCPDGNRDGSHYFATTLAEHNANIQRANEECAGA